MQCQCTCKVATNGVDPTLNIETYISRSPLPSRAAVGGDDHGGRGVVGEGREDDGRGEGRLGGGREGTTKCGYGVWLGG